jgi:hypothetical protein
VSQLRQRENELDELGMAVVVVTFQSGYFERAYVQETGLQWPLLVDESRELYRAYGMERGRFWDIFGPKSLALYVKLVLHGRRPRAAVGDPRQLGGDVLVDPSGIVQLHHVGAGPADRPSVDAILNVVRRGEGE